eukprot:7449397-Heterocapsa_arctica.AAC.1
MRICEDPPSPSNPFFTASLAFVCGLLAAPRPLMGPRPVRDRASSSSESNRDLSPFDHAQSRGELWV